jgi:hypothetical protein
VAEPEESNLNLVLDNLQVNVTSSRVKEAFPQSCILAPALDTSLFLINSLHYHHSRTIQDLAPSEANVNIISFPFHELVKGYYRARQPLTDSCHIALIAALLSNEIWILNSVKILRASKKKFGSYIDNSK